ncbi:hypothetical protein ACFU6R_03355 [Streptomyces sp. NPDC057499]|uniref:DUF7187 family protein n=1 Tax=Streptomyces sp. NPDC057499 TaxID=3346150 RepID=UPI0036C02D83
MNDEEFEGLELPDDLVFDHYDAVKRAASIVGDLRKALREEGFTREETFELVRTYWTTEMELVP